MSPDKKFGHFPQVLIEICWFMGFSNPQLAFQYTKTWSEHHGNWPKSGLVHLHHPTLCLTLHKSSQQRQNVLLYHDTRNLISESQQVSSKSKHSTAPTTTVQLLTLLVRTKLCSCYTRKHNSMRFKLRNTVRKLHCEPPSVFVKEKIFEWQVRVNYIHFNLKRHWW